MRLLNKTTNITSTFFKHAPTIKTSFSLWNTINDICCVITFVKMSSTGIPLLNEMSSTGTPLLTAIQVEQIRTYAIWKEK
jgi:hypothetical protein